MTLQSKVESFLSHGKYLMFSKIDNEIILYLGFEEKDFDIFKVYSNYVDLYNYMEGRKIKLTINETDAYYRASLIDTKTAEAININNAKFLTNQLEGFINSVPITQVMPFFIMCFKDEMKVMQPIVEDRSPLLIHGYSFAYKKS